MCIQEPENAGFAGTVEIYLMKFAVFYIALTLNVFAWEPAAQAAGAHDPSFSAVGISLGDSFEEVIKKFPPAAVSVEDSRTEPLRMLTVRGSSISTDSDVWVIDSVSDKIDNIEHSSGFSFGQKPNLDWLIQQLQVRFGTFTAIKTDSYPSVIHTDIVWQFKTTSFPASHHKIDGCEVLRRSKKTTFEEPCSNVVTAEIVSAAGGVVNSYILDISTNILYLKYLRDKADLEAKQAKEAGEAAKANTPPI